MQEDVSELEETPPEPVKEGRKTDVVDEVETPDDEEDDRP